MVEELVADHGVGAEDEQLAPFDHHRVLGISAHAVPVILLVGGLAVLGVFIAEGAENAAFDIVADGAANDFRDTLATGAALVGECVRCLAEVDDTIDSDLTELFVYDDGKDEAADDEDDETSRLQGDLLDLEPVLRDAVVLALPFQPLCREDCPGLCAECGARLADDPEHHHEEPEQHAYRGPTPRAAPTSA